MADAMDTLKEILGDDAEDKIKGVMSSLSGSSGSEEEAADNSDFNSDIRALMDKLGSPRSDPRANLLLSLRPYMSDGRKRSIDGAVRLLNLSKLSGLMKNI